MENRVLLHSLASRLSCRRPASGAASLDSPEAEIARPEVVMQSKSTGKTLPLAIPGESVQGNCPRGYSLWKYGVCLQAGTGSSATGNTNRVGRGSIIWRHHCSK